MTTPCLINLVIVVMLSLMATKCWNQIKDDYTAKHPPQIRLSLLPTSFPPRLIQSQDCLLLLSFPYPLLEGPLVYHSILAMLQAGLSLSKKT